MHCPTAKRGGKLAVDGQTLVDQANLQSIGFLKKLGVTPFQLLRLVWYVWKAKIKHGILGARPPPEKSIAEFLQSVTGSTVMGDRLVSGILHGIWGGSLSTLGTNALAMPWHKLHRSRALTRKFGKGSSRLIMTETQYALCQMLGHDEKLLAEYLSHQDHTMLYLAGGWSALIGELEKTLNARPNVKILKGSPVKSTSYDAQTNTVNV